jgi:Spy/CpxP family protein refolding chaperone
VNSWKIILATAVIFGSGVVTGGLLVHHVERTSAPGRRPAEAVHRAKAGNAELPLPRPQLLNQQFVKQLDARLHLTPVQRQKIEKIIADGQARNRDLWKLVAPQFRAVMQDVRQNIRATLTPEQRRQFEELLRQLTPRRPPVNPAPPQAPEATNAPVMAGDFRR